MMRLLIFLTAYVLRLSALLLRPGTRNERELRLFAEKKSAFNHWALEARW